MRVCVVGLWHLGTVTAAGLAELGHDVVGVDRDAERTAGLARGIPPLREPGLGELIRQGVDARRLTFSTDLRTAAAACDCVWLTFDTPVDDNDQSDLSTIWDAVDVLADALRPGALVVVSSQVPVGTCAEIERRLGGRADVACVPENLRLGVAIERFRHPNMIVVGVRSTTAGARVKDLIGTLSSEILVIDTESAEMIKHAINAFLATSISFANELSAICERVGADAAVVARALRLDERIGPKARVDPGLGFAGGTLARDLRTLQRLGRSYDVPTPLVDAVLDVNQRQMGWVERSLRRRLAGLGGRRIAVLGLTYTPNTSTLRRSAALAIIGDLVRGGAGVSAYDPGVAASDIPVGSGIELVTDAYAVARSADALVLITDWPVFRDLDYARIRTTMRRPLLLDPKRMLDADGMIGAGWEYVAVGRGAHA